MKSIIAAFCVLSALAGLGQADDYLLDGKIVPVSYILEITPFFVNENYNGKNETADTFLGKATIVFRTTEADIRKLVLHINDLEIENYGVGGRTAAGMNFTEADYNATNDQWSIDLGVDAPVNSYTLTVNYRGHMRDDMAGFYKSYYYENGTKVWMASTQFQPSDARRAFPCFDEPRFKTPFTIIINRPSDMNSVSNTRILSSDNSTSIGGRFKDTFETTPPLSTYLIAFIVSKYEKNSDDDNFGVLSRPAAKPATQYALRFGKSMLAKFGEYLGIDYYTLGTKTKMDMASIPDFSAGAMENWGLLTYRESSFLYYNDSTTDLTEQRIMGIIAHEQAHQWFGDLVTCSWWSHTWLNEGFARYFQFFGVEMLQSSWELEEQFVVENLQQSMQLDATDATHPMTDDTVRTKGRSSSMFDNISYNKAASIIRMLKHYIGVDKFNQTLQAHLADNKDKAITPDALMTAIEKVSPNANIAGWFAPWTTTPGFPLVTVKLENDTLKLTQKRFMRTGQTSPATERYSIPITYMIDNENPNDVTPKFVFWANETGEKSVVLPKNVTKYYILNPKQTGYYRVNYDQDNWNKIKEALKKENFDGIPIMSRAQIVDDLLNLARSGVVNYTDAVDIVFEHLKNETEYIPWLAATNNGLTFLSQRLNISNTEHARLFTWFVTTTMKTAYEKLTFDAKTGEKQTEKYNRVNIQSWMCKYGNQDCIDKSKAHFAKFVNGTAVPKNQRTTVYCNAVRYGNVSEFDHLYDNLMKQDMASEQLNFLVGMACTKNKDLVTKYLDRLMKTDDIRPQDRASTINNILNSNPEGVDFLYDYVTANHVEWNKKMGSYSTLDTIAGRFTTEEQFNKYTTWLETTKAPLGTSHGSLVSNAAAAKKNLEWDDKYMTELMAHLLVISSATAKAVSMIVSIISFTVLYFMN